MQHCEYPHTRYAYTPYNTQWCVKNTKVMMATGVNNVCVCTLRNHLGPFELTVKWLNCMSTQCVYTDDVYTWNPEMKFVSSM